MVSKLEILEKEALLLPEEQRVTLAHRMLRSAEPPSDSAVEALWEAEIVRRIGLLDIGATGRHRASDVFADLDKRLGT